jgi:PAS domain S-box-containing protein
MLSVTALRAPGGDVVGYLGVFSDMTGRKRIEAQLNHSRERFELATRGAVDGIWDWNVRTGYFYLSDRWFELLGYKHGELPPKLDTWHAQLHPDEREAVVNAMLAHLDRRVPYDIECRVRAKDGSYRWFRACGQASWDSAGVPQRMAGSLTDITERRLADEKLRFSEERFRNAVEYSAIGIALVGLDGRWLQVNRAICSMLGYTAKELLALTFQDITHPDDLKTDLTYVDDMLSGRISTYQMEKRYVRKNGVLVWALLNVSLVRGTAGEPVHFVSQVQDITARKHAELQRVALLGVTVALAESTSLEESALRILQSVCTHLSWDFGAVWKVTSEESPLRCVALWPGGDKNLAGFEAATRSITFRRGAGLPGRIWKSGRTCWIDDLASDRNFPRAAVAAAAGLHAGCGFPIIVGGEVRGVVEFFSHEVRERDTASEELFASIGVQIGQIMERWHAGEQLAANEALLRQFVRHTPAAVAMLDTSLRYLQASDNWIRDYHLDGRPVLGRSHYEVFPDIPERWKEIHRRVLAGAVERCDEDPYERADGTLEWLQWEARPWHKAGGEIGGLIFFTQVITERKRAEQALRESLAEKEILLKEIHHRVKNNMQVISSMLSLQAGYIEDPRMRALFADCQDRVQCMAMIHEKLYRAHNLATIDFGVHIRDLADMLFRSHAIPAGLGDVRLEIEADPVTLDIDTSIPAGLILNELLTNALKHAFPDQKAGVVRVTLKRTPPDMLLLTVTDNGVGLPSGLEEGLNRSMGLKMIRSLTRQIGGTLDVHRESGAGFRIRFPAPPSARLRVGPTPEMPSAPT